MPYTPIAPRPLRIFGKHDIERIPALRRISADERLAMRAVAEVLPFRVNEYVLEDLIDWSRVPDDPIYQLTLPQPGMLDAADLARMIDLLRGDASREQLAAAAREIQNRLNPHPAAQMELNVPRLDAEPLRGMQHKYRETVLFFPVQGQTCHTYCTYCFRWAQFVGIDELKFAARDGSRLVAYLRQHPEVSSVLFTGGDPMVMNVRRLRQYLEPLLQPGLEHIISIRIGTKALSYWPYRFLTERDSDELMRLFEQVRRAGKHMAIMAHYSHPRELSTPAAQTALRRVLVSGVVVRCQAPLIRHVNDLPQVWGDLWRHELQLGAIPYYMFVERDTGPKQYFRVPLARALSIYQEAFATLSGLGRTVRGPVMSARPGKVLVDGTAEVGGERLFVLKMIQGRDPKWVNRIFFARYDDRADWLTDLRPGLGEREFFFAEGMREIERQRTQPAWGEELVRREPLAFFGGVDWE